MSHDPSSTGTFPDSYVEEPQQAPGPAFGRKTEAQCVLLYKGSAFKPWVGDGRVGGRACGHCGGDPKKHGGAA